MTYQQSVLKRYHSDKHLSDFYLQDGGNNQLASIWNKITYYVHDTRQLSTLSVHLAD